MDKANFRKKLGYMKNKVLGFTLFLELICMQFSKGKRER
jgi:hypothetical protein